MSKKEFIKVLQENQGIIRKVSNSYCKNIEDRNDLVQEITLQLWKSWSKYDKQYKLSTWMYKISLNVAISFYRKTYNRNTLNQTIQEENLLMYEGGNIELSDNIKELYYHISQLNELNKALILLYLEDYNYEEIAATLGISKTNVATKVSRIKEVLKKKFK